MGRAPQPGGPQRVSAHVVPKAKPFSEDDPDEKTTLDPESPASSSSQWEDEASTTVEQGEVADKIRALGVEPAVPLRPITGLTNTGASALEEPTVDDQKAQPQLGTDVARLVITQGN